MEPAAANTSHAVEQQQELPSVTSDLPEEDIKYVKDEVDYPPPVTSVKTLYDFREQMGDVTFELPCGQKIRASKIILVANCRYFESMFPFDPSGKPSGKSVIQIENTTAEAFEYLIKFCYYGYELFDHVTKSDMAQIIRHKISKKDECELSFIFDFIDLCEMYNLPDVVNKTTALVSAAMVFLACEDKIFILVQAYKANCVCSDWLTSVASIFKNYFDHANDDQQLEDYKRVIRVNTSFLEYSELYIDILERALLPWKTLHNIYNE